MDLHYLKLFNTLASELSFSKAADKLFISQPAVSMQIKKLETELSVKLFDKVGKSIFLNDNGKMLYEFTKKIFTLVDEAEACFKSQSGILKGVINIGASNTPGTYIMPRILGEFKEVYPDVNTNLHVGNTYEIDRMIFENRVDFAVNGGDILYSSEVNVEKLMNDEVMLVSSPNNRLAELEYVERDDLKSARYITHEKNSQLCKLLEDILNELGLPANIAMTLGSIDAIKQAVSADLGISAIPRSAICMELKFGLLKQFKIKDKKWLYPYNLIYHKKRQLSVSAKKLMELVKLRMRNTPC